MDSQILYLVAQEDIFTLPMQIQDQTLAVWTKASIATPIYKTPVKNCKMTKNKFLEARLVVRIE